MFRTYPPFISQGIFRIHPPFISQDILWMNLSWNLDVLGRKEAEKSWKSAESNLWVGHSEKA